MIKNGVAGKEEDTPKHDHAIFSTRRSHHFDDAPSSASDASFLCETVLVGNNEQAVLAAAERARALGYNPVVLGTSMDGEAQHVGRIYVSMAMQIRRSIEKNLPFQMVSTLPIALVVGGETTVTLPADNEGKGGRNQELSLSAALAMRDKGIRNVVLASVGTDGTDGPTDAAGAMVDGGTIDRIESSSEMLSYLSNQNTSSLSGLDALRKHDAYHFFEQEFKRYNERSGGMKFSQRQKALHKPGPTGTNVADIAVVLIS
jgi:glycerate-2-kinase